MMILAMLEEGKISSEEASKLIEALDEAELKELKTLNFNNSSSEEATSTSKVTDENKINSTKNNWEDTFERKMEKFGEKMESKFGKDFEEKMERTGENLGEKMGKLGENIAEGTMSFTDKILDLVDNIVDNTSFTNLFGSYETIEEKLEKDISQIDDVELVFEAVNGKIALMPWKGDKVVVKAVCNIKKKDLDIKESIYTIVEEGNKVIFKPIYTSNIGTKLTVNLPEKDYKKIKAHTTNGKIQADNITSNDLILNTTNSSIILSHIDTKDLYLSTKNGRIIIDNTNGERFSLNTANSTIDLKESSCEAIEAITKNARILLENLKSTTIKAKTTNGSINMTNCATTSINAITSNSKILLDNIDTDLINDVYAQTTNSSIDASFKHTDALFNIDAKTSMGHINVNIPNLIYELNDQRQLGSKKILAHSPDYSRDKGIKIVANTSNGSIKIQ